MTDDIGRTSGFELGGSKVDCMVYIIDDLKFDFMFWIVMGEALNTSILFCWLSHDYFVNY